MTPTGRSGPACCACPAWPTSPSGASGCSRCRCSVDPAQHAGARRLARRRHGRRPPTPSTPACCGTPTGNVIGTGGFVDTPEPAARRSGTSLPIVSRRATWRRSRSSTATAASVLRSATSPTWSTGHQPLIGDAVINDGPGLLLVVEKLPWANTLEVTKGVDDGARRAAARAARHRRSTPRSSGRPTSSSIAIDNLTLALLLGCLLVVAGPDRLPVRVADRADQPASRSRCR